jgi:hypothetical protein
MDADMAIDPLQVPELVAALRDADVAIGSLALPGTRVDYGNVPRTVMGWTFNRIVNAATGVRLYDTQCGFKALRAPVARLLFHCSVIDRFAFDVEILFRARRMGLRIAEVPVRWDNARGSSIRPLRDPLSMVLDLASCRLGRSAPRPLCGHQLPSGTGAGAELDGAGLGGPWGANGTAHGDQVIVVTATGRRLALRPLREAGPEDDLMLTVDALEAMGPISVLDAAPRAGARGTPAGQDVALSEARSRSGATPGAVRPIPLT